MHMLFESAHLNWIILAIILFIVEVSSFTLLFLWLGIAALIVAAIVFFLPNLSLSLQLFCFALTAIISVIVWHFSFRRSQRQMGDNKMNNRALRYVGQTATLVEPVKNGFAKIKIEDSLWRVKCDTELLAGDTVRITAAESVVLIVEAIAI